MQGRKPSTAARAAWRLNGITAEIRGAIRVPTALPRESGGPGLFWMAGRPGGDVPKESSTNNTNHTNDSREVAPDRFPFVLFVLFVDKKPGSPLARGREGSALPAPRISAISAVNFLCLRRARSVVPTPPPKPQPRRSRRYAELSVFSPLSPAKAGAQAFSGWPVGLAAMYPKELSTNNTNHTNDSREVAPDRFPFVLFVLFVDKKPGIPACAGKSGVSVARSAYLRDLRG